MVVSTLVFPITVRLAVIGDTDVVTALFPITVFT